MSDGEFWVGTVRFDAWSFAQVIDFILGKDSQSARPPRTEPGTAIHFANAYNVALAESSCSYRKLLIETDFIFADGVPVLWAAQLLSSFRTKPTWERVYGPDVMRATLAASDNRHRHFLLGGTEKVLERLHQNIGERYPNAQIVGSYAPPFCEQFSQSEYEHQDRRIAESAPTHIWVGLGTPKQDFEVVRLAHSHPAKCLAVGAAFDYLSDSAVEAPLMMRKLGLQWFQRLAHEPRRLMKRYTLGNLVFLFSVLRTSVFRD